MEPDTDRAPIYAWRQIFETFDAVCAADRPDQMLRTLPAELARPVRALIEAAPGRHAAFTALPAAPQNPRLRLIRIR